MSETAETVAPARDVRVDQIGFVGELQKRHADLLKTRVKCRMLEEELDVVRGEYFQGLFVKTTETTVDPAKLLALYDAGRISRANFLSAIKVVKEPLSAFLTGDQVEKMSTTAVGSPALRVTRLQGVEVALVDALKQLGSSIPR